MRTIQALAEELRRALWCDGDVVVLRREMVRRVIVELDGIVDVLEELGNPEGEPMELEKAIALILKGYGYEQHVAAAHAITILLEERGLYLADKRKP